MYDYPNGQDVWFAAFNNNLEYLLRSLVWASIPLSYLGSTFPYALGLECIHLYDNIQTLKHMSYRYILHLHVNKCKSNMMKCYYDDTEYLWMLSKKSNICKSIFLMSLALNDTCNISNETKFAIIMYGIKFSMNHS